MSEHNNLITFTRPEYREALAIWKVNRDVCRGPLAVRRGGYLPKLNPSDTSDQNKKRNDDYADRAIFYAITGNTKIGLLGMAFRIDPSISVDSGDKLAYLKTNADGAGNSIYQQSQQTLENILETARHGLYVDYVKKEDKAFIYSYQAEDIINWRTECIEGQDKLVLVVLREMIEVPDGFGFTLKPQYRELALEDGVFVVRVWRETGAGADPKSPSVFSIAEEIIPRPKGENYWTEIPFMFVGAQNNDSSIDDAPLEPLVHINLGHYRNSADYEDSVHFCGQIQPWISGLTPEWRDFLQKNGIKFGSRNPMLLPVGGAMGLAQGQPNMLAKEAMEDKRAYMIALGARLIEQNGVAKTATQAGGDQATATSILGMCSGNVSEAHTIAIMWCARYLGIKDIDGIAFELSKDYLPQEANPGLINAIIAAWQSNAIPTLDMIRALQKMGLIDQGENPETILDQLNSMGPNFLGGINGNAK